MKDFRTVFFTASLALMATGVASADTVITQTFTLPSGSSATNWTSSAAINQFNTSLGTLEWIKISDSYTTTVTGAATDANAGSTGADQYLFSGTTNLALTDAFSNLLLAPTTTVSSTFNNVSNGQVLSVPTTTSTGTSSAKWYVDPTNAAAVILCNNDVAGCLGQGGTTGTVDPLDYMNFEGNGTINITGTAATFAAFSGPSYANASGSGTASESVTVQYDYIASVPSTTPEPGTMALFGGALIGLGVLRRRVRS